MIETQPDTEVLHALRPGRRQVWADGVATMPKGLMPGRLCTASAVATNASMRRLVFTDFQPENVDSSPTPKRPAARMCFAPRRPPVAAARPRSRYSESPRSPSRWKAVPRSMRNADRASLRVFGPG